MVTNPAIAAQTDTRRPAAPAVPPLRIVFFGTPAFAVPSLDALIAARPHQIVGVVTQPDRPRGRGQKTSDAPVKARAAAAGLPILQPERMKDPAFLDALAALNADLGVVAAYGRILTDAILAIPRLGMINVHASILPKYRGAAPVHRAVIAGETSTGVTIMRVVKALDAGPTIVKEHHPIGPDDTSDEVERALAEIGARLVAPVVDLLARNNAAEYPQDEAQATYAHRLTKEDGVIDWNWPAARVHNLIRGLHPWPHAFSFVQGKRVILRRSEIVSPGPKGPGLRGDVGPGLRGDVGPGPRGDVGPGLRGDVGPGLRGDVGPGLRGDVGPGLRGDVGRVLSDPPEPGMTVEAEGDRLIVATGDGLLRILEIQAEGKRPMSARDFLSGHRLATGDRFETARRKPDTTET